MKLRCPLCSTELETDEHPPESIVCPACEAEAPAAHFIRPPPVPPSQLPKPAAAPAPAVVFRKPVESGAFLRFVGSLATVLGLFVGLFSLMMGTANGSTHNIGLISERATVALAGLALIVLGIGLHLIGQLQMTNAHLARLNEREP
jgi:predicted lipid-binding transport protein (Tim44 family)